VAVGGAGFTTSAELRAIVSDETGTGALVFQDGALGNATATSLKTADGAVGTPSYSFSSETNSGLYRSGSGAVKMAILGRNCFDFQLSGASNSS
jgi:hypothetical protein